MSEQILTVGFQLSGGEIESKNFSDRISLLDWDIVLFTTNINNSFYLGSDLYNGKISLSDNTSFSFVESLNHWKKEIKEAYENGKSIIIFLDDYKELYIATGERTYSGTGKNRQTTRMVSLTNNYIFIPTSLEARNSIGKSMILDNKIQYLKPFFESFGKLSTYKVTFEQKSIFPLIKTKTGNKTVGGIIQNKESGGYILFLPSIDFTDDSFTQRRGEKLYWSQKGKEFGFSLISNIVQLNKSIRNELGKSPLPEWVINDRYLLPEEISIREEMIEKEKIISEIQDKLNIAKENLNQVVSIKDLLYEQGKPLERAIMKALDYLGFKTSQYKENDSEFDVIFECSEGRFLGEAEGKDNKSISIEKLRQLEMNINEDFARETIDSMAKGVLFGNPCRLLPLEKRVEHFTDKCQIAAKRSEIALIKTSDLFLIFQNLNAEDEDMKTRIRIKILNSTGIVDFSEFINIELEDTQDGNN